MVRRGQPKCQHDADARQSLDSLKRAMRHAVADADKAIEHERGKALHSVQELRVDSDAVAAQRRLLEEERNELLRQIELCDRQLQEVQAVSAELQGSGRAPFWAFCMVPGAWAQAQAQPALPPPPGGDFFVDVGAAQAIVVSGAGSAVANGRYLRVAQGGAQLYQKEGDEDFVVQWCEEPLGDPTLPACWQLVDRYDSKPFYFCEIGSKDRFRAHDWEVFAGAETPAPTFEVLDSH